MMSKEEAFWNVPLKGLLNSLICWRKRRWKSRERCPWGEKQIKGAGYEGIAERRMRFPGATRVKGTPGFLSTSTPVRGRIFLVDWWTKRDD